MPNLLIQETVDKYGYDPSLLSKHSEKLVLFKCDFCLRPFESTLKAFHRNQKFSCKSCLYFAKKYIENEQQLNKHEFYLKERTDNDNYLEIESTIKKYGYDPLQLEYFSHKLVIAKCEFCLKSFETKFFLLNKKPGVCCKNCDAIAAAYSRLKSTENKNEFYSERRTLKYISLLNIDETINAYGYSPLTINTFSSKKVCANCKYCNQLIHMRMSKFSTRNGRISCWSCMRKKTVETLKEKYGVESTLDIPSVQAQLTNPKTEQLIESYLKNNYGISYERNYSVGPYSFDFYLPDHNLLIECQGDYFHDFKNNGYSGTSKDQAKSTYVEVHTNHKLVWIWEHELHLGRLKKILDYHINKVCEPEITVKLNDLIFKKIENHQAHVFLSQYHYLGNLGTIASSFGAFYADQLVAVIVFGGITRNQSIKKINTNLQTNYGPKEIRELRRFCIKPNVINKNMASFCLSKLIKYYVAAHDAVKLIMSFSDESVGDIGTIYKATNWQQLPNTNKSYHYLDLKTTKQIHKKTVWDLARSNHCSESEFATNSNLVKVEELPKKVWIMKVS